MERAAEILGAILGDAFSLRGISVVPRRVPSTWREGRIQARLSDVGPNNQAAYRSLPENPPSRHGLKFFNEAEAAVYDALVRAQQRLAPEATVGILPGAGVRVPGRTFWPDIVVTYRGRAAAIEIDGPHHRNRAAADQSRDRQLMDAGMVLVERIVVEDTADPADLDLFVERLLARLMAR